MSWEEGVAVAVVFLGLGAGASLVAQRPSFWIEFGSRLGKALLLLEWLYVSKRMPPEEEAAWREAQLSFEHSRSLDPDAGFELPHFSCSMISMV